MKELKEIPLFIIDSSVLIKMFEGKDKDSSLKVLNMMARMKKDKVPFSAVTTFVSFLRALWMAEPNSKLEDIQSTMDIIDILKTKEHDYKNKEKVMNDIINLAKNVSELSK